MESSARKSAHIGAVNQKMDKLGASKPLPRFAKSAGGSG
jgi:hypothetical protein